MITTTQHDLLINIILIMFPILVYCIIMCYKGKASREYDDLVLNVALATSLYLCLRFGNMANNSKVLLFCNIPIVIAYMKKKPMAAILLSIGNIIYCYAMYDSLYIGTTIKYVSYLILYLCANKKKISTDSFILSIAVLQGFFLSFEYFFQDETVVVTDFFELFIIVFVYYFITFVALYIFKIIEKIKNLNDSLEQLEKEKEIKNALFKLTHEIKNPLAVCKGYLEMIDLDKKEKSTKYITIMKQEINRSLNIMTDFMEFNKIKIVKEQVDLNLLLEDVYDCFKVIVKSKNIQLLYETEEEENYFMGDYERLKQVLINLIKNSVESMEETGKIKIYSKTFKNHLDIVVEDTGVGMDKDALEKLKAMFYTTKKNGSGLGVALSNEIVKSHGGDLIYESEINKGTKVTIRLPYTN